MGTSLRIKPLLFVIGALCSAGNVFFALLAPNIPAALAWVSATIAWILLWAGRE